MKIRSLGIEKMKEIEGGGWSWSGCIEGAVGAGLMPVIATAWNPWLAAGVLAFSCVGGGLEL